MSNESIIYLIGACVGVFSVALWAAFVLVPAWTAYTRWWERVVAAFQAAVASGDPAPLAQVLSEDVIFYADGGGKRLTALRPIYGREKVLRFLKGVSTKGGAVFSEFVRTSINGQPGFLLRGPEGVESITLGITGEQLTALYHVRNPDKLRHLS